LTSASIRFRASSTKAAKIAARDVGFDVNAPLAVIATDLVQPFGETELGELAERNRGPWLALGGRQHHRQRTAEIEVVALRAGQADGDIEPPVSLEYLPGGPAPERGGDRISEFLDGLSLEHTTRMVGHIVARASANVVL
jgi:hypothetical protein